MIKKWWLILYFIISQFLFSAPVERVSFKLTLREDVPVTTQFPVGIYWVPKASMPEIRQAGFNYVIPIPQEISPIISGGGKFARTALAYLDAARENGLKCGFFLDKRDLEAYQSGQLSWERLAEALGLLAGHPALLFYYFRDEPENEEGSAISDPRFLEELAARIKELDPVHPTFLVNFATRVYHKYAYIPDIYSIDLYPVPNLPLKSIVPALDLAFKVTSSQSPVWFTVQAFGNTSGITRPPSPVELRNMTYLSLVQGVEGIQFFRYCGERWRSLQPLSLWNEMVEVTGELNQLSPVLTRGSRVDRAQVKSPAALDLAVIVHENASYLIAVNTENRLLQGKLELPVNPGRIEVLFEDRLVKADGASFSDEFKPYATHIYKLERYIWLQTGLRGPLVEAEQPLELLVLHNLPTTGEFTYQVDTLPGKAVSLSKTGGFFSWIPPGKGDYKLSVAVRSGEEDVSTSLVLKAGYIAAPDVWQSYAVKIDPVRSRGEVADGNGKSLGVDFYTAPAADVTAALPFTDYKEGAHPLLWNRVDSFWSFQGEKNYAYVGKKTTPRFVNFTKDSHGLPGGVRDLAIHPPCGSRVTVAALTIPEPGSYQLLELGVRKDAGCGNPLVLKLYDSSPLSLLTLLSSGQEWILSRQMIELGVLEAGQKIYFSLGSLGDCSCDFGEIRWTLQRLQPQE